MLQKCKALQREKHVKNHGRTKKNKAELEEQLLRDPSFIRFQEEVTAHGSKVRASTVPKLLKIVDDLISKEYKMALLESTQRRAKGPAAVIEAVRQEALRKLMHEEDVLFDEAGMHNEFTMAELQERLDNVARSRSAHHTAAAEVRPLPQPPPPPLQLEGDGSCESASPTAATTVAQAAD